MKKINKKGWASTSERKRASARANMEKAREALSKIRWDKARDEHNKKLDEQIKEGGA